MGRENKRHLRVYEIYTCVCVCVCVRVCVCARARACVCVCIYKACMRDNLESALSSVSLLQVRGLRQLSCPLAPPNLSPSHDTLPADCSHHAEIYALATRPNAQLYHPSLH